MNVKLVQSLNKKAENNLTVLATKKTDFKKIELSDKERKYLKSSVEKDEKLVTFHHEQNWIQIHIFDCEKVNHILAESFRKAGASLVDKLNSDKADTAYVLDLIENPLLTESFVEGALMANYQFVKYYKDAKSKENTLKHLHIQSSAIKNKKIDELLEIRNCLFTVRDLINEPSNVLNTNAFVEILHELSKNKGFQLEVFDKLQIESLRMGGLLAVNKGSAFPPYFAMLQWKPENAKNEKPIVVVGKGIVYDTGGLSLKSNSNMNTMKSDMAGAAITAGLISLFAALNLPVFIIGLIPMTDNAISNHAYAPGDVIKMHNGLFVENMNSDAEGRLILADALSYAKRYNPLLTIDVATLTGAAVAAVGAYANVVMGNASEDIFAQLKTSGENTYERIVQFPLWEEYGKLLKSDIADMKNIGGPEAGAITAGKFLENFVDYPWIHIDIAPSAFNTTSDSYRKKGGTGTGLRLLYSFISNFVHTKK